ncbi:hypothetical protein VTK73DRAFT_5562 [Phialemonium thermophilum]|uniref:CFEM domain-containing protein n=1 Tax=Phialemonium thermophilum TaxID=223376 RepID=A0ABR3XYF0_9PEZI
MRILPCLVMLLCASQQAAAAVQEDITTPPTCGLQCLGESLATSSCSMTDNTCICADAALNKQVTACVERHCSIREQLQMKRYSTEACGVEGEDRRDLVWIIAIVFGLLGLAAFILRCLARLYVTAQTWGLDDWAMSVAVCVMIALSVIAIPLTQHGLGLDMWNVSSDDITAVLRLYFWDEMIYVSCLALTKVSILLFYLKVFPGRTFKFCAYALIALNSVYALSFIFILIFQCDPIPGAWRQWDGEFPAKCISINIIGWTAAAINIALDLAVIILPLPPLLRLSMSLKKKLQIILMFTVGLFVTAVSVIRLRSLIRFGNTTNITQDYVEVGYWSTIEVPVGIICACMPAIRSLFSMYFPKLFGTTKSGTSYPLGSLDGPLQNGNSSRLGVTSNNGRSQIKVKHEWTVVTNMRHDRYSSESALVQEEVQSACRGQSD